MRLNIKSAWFALRHDTLMLEKPPAGGGGRLILLTSAHVAGLNLPASVVEDPSQMAQVALYLGQNFLDMRDGPKPPPPLAVVEGEDSEGNPLPATVEPMDLDCICGGPEDCACGGTCRCD